MAALFIQNVALGKVAYYTSLPAANDGLILVLLKTTGIQADDALRDHTTLAAMLAASNDECDFTGYARRVLANAANTIDNVANALEVDADDPASFTNTGGASQAASAAFICYDPDLAVNDDATIIPLLQVLENPITFDIGVATSFQFDADGFFGA